MPETREFCSVSCRQAYRNHPDRNPSKSPEARKKISESRKGKPTSLGLPCPEAKKRKISKALMGKPTGRRPSQKSIDAFVKAGEKYRICGVSGPEHPMWKGGYSKTRAARYNTPEYKNFVQTCLERDNYTCQWCGARNGMGETVILQVHHKIHFWERPDLGYDPDNGISLCISCHRKAHKGMKITDIPEYKGQPRTCIVCGKEYLTKNGGRKFCTECQDKYCCPVCGSTVCLHHARTKSKQSLPPEFFKDKLPLFSG